MTKQKKTASHSDSFLIFGFLTGLAILGGAYFASILSRPERVATILDIVCRIPLLMIVLLLLLLWIKTSLVYLNKHRHVNDITSPMCFIERIGLFSCGIALGTSFCFLIKIVKQLAGS